MPQLITGTFYKALECKRFLLATTSVNEFWQLISDQLSDLPNMNLSGDKERNQVSCFVFDASTKTPSHEFFGRGRFLSSATEPLPRNQICDKNHISTKFKKPDLPSTVETKQECGE